MLIFEQAPVLENQYFYLDPTFTPRNFKPALIMYPTDKVYWNQFESWSILNLIAEYFFRLSSAKLNVT